MREMDPALLGEREVYKLLTGTIVPRPIAFVTSQSDSGVVNGAPFSYFSIVSTDPPVLSISLQRKNGELKDTARNILERKEFVVHGVDSENLFAVNETAASLPPQESEIVKANMTLLKSTRISVPGIHESKVRLECELYAHYPMESQGRITADLILGRVVYAHVSEDIEDQGRIRMRGYDPVARLAGPNYSTLGEIIHLERPE